MAEHTFAGLSCSEVADLAPAFVLGALEQSESGSVRRHLAECPEAHPEMAELHSVIPALFEVAEPVAPPAGLKERILAAAAADTQRPAPEVRSPRLVEERRPGWSGLFRRPVWAAISLAAAIAVAALGAWNVQLQSDIAALAAYRDGVVGVLDAAAKPGSQLAVLGAPEGEGPTGLAAVAADGSVALVMRDLAPTSGAEVYEVWLIAAGSDPVPVGELRVGADRTATLVTTQAPLGAGLTVALTREPGPDSATPTLPIIAVGVGRSEAS